MTMRAFIYVRVSSLSQSGDKHVSLEMQVAMCREAAKTLGFDKFTVLKDIGSGRLPEKLKSQARLWKMARHGSTVFCHSYDRISRDMAYAAQLIKTLHRHKITLKSVSEPLDYSTPAGYHQLINVFNNAELSSRTTGLKVRDALAHIRNGGGCPGQAPYGWEIDPTQPVKERKLRPCEKEQRVIFLVRALRLGTKSLVDINTILKTVVLPNRPDLQEDIVIRNEDDTLAVRPIPKLIDYDNLANILNDWEISYRSTRRWSARIVRNIVLHKKYVSDDDQMNIEMETINLQASASVAVPQVEAVASAVVAPVQPTQLHAIPVVVPPSPIGTVACAAAPYPPVQVPDTTALAQQMATMMSFMQQHFATAAPAPTTAPTQTAFVAPAPVPLDVAVPSSTQPVQAHIPVPTAAHVEVQQPVVPLPPTPARAQVRISVPASSASRSNLVRARTRVRARTNEMNDD